ncbi:ferrous iron transport protein B [Acinetobacter johnsonii]|uniref:Ferrous iron transport protein B n=1 Tax=Acinetobacter johnsonii TaxID=40214 RepID=A0AAJ6IGB3_ACIJO|nr:ferrous iron transport protein B [Acinetobacter johnsonii]ALV74210.1 iron transporter FeoB [Acinetobacter johnsonii XBB1]WMG19490.1 ferrous iron transport protein B [Acinetobacter johnsonii]
MKTNLRIALVGNPNCGKTSLFNHLTGTRQKVANYAGVTVEKKVGNFTLPSSKQVRILDLPGTYSLSVTSIDEAITRDVCKGLTEEGQQDVFICVVDATNLKLHLGLVLEVLALGRPVLVVLNMMDEARRRGIQINIEKLSQHLGVPVVETVAVKSSGLTQLIDALDKEIFHTPHTDLTAKIDSPQKHIEYILATTITDQGKVDTRTEFLDKILIHPVAGLLILAITMFIVFQAVFAWANPFIEMLENLFSFIGEFLGSIITQPLLNSLVVDGIIGGVGSIIVYLPQILILFFFIFVLEESGYLPRASFLLDKLMVSAGLSGRAFIPLLSSFACAIPGIMATRTITDRTDRIATIMVAPLMTCSARLPVYALLIAAFIPNQTVAGIFNLQGVVLFGLYIAGIVSALIVSLVMKLFRKNKENSLFLMELPAYRMPNWRSVFLGVYERAWIFIRRVGGIIFALTILLWFLCTFPTPPENATLPSIDYSFAGMLGHFLQPIFAPIGFNWQITIALIPGLAAREVVVAALGTVYALSGSEEAQAETLVNLITADGTGWSLATGLSLLVWFIYAPNCLATLATIRRETGSMRTVTIMVVYMFALAYLMAFFTYQLVSHYWG